MCVEHVARQIKTFILKVKYSVILSINILSADLKYFRINFAFYKL